METGWTGPMIIKNKKFNVSAHVTLIPQTGLTGDNLQRMLSHDYGHGYLIAINDVADYLSTLHGTNHRGVGTTPEFIFISDVNKLYPPYIDTGAHEAGHSMGLGDVESSKDEKAIPSIMQPATVTEPGGRRHLDTPPTKRKKPDGSDLEDIFKKHQIDPNKDGDFPT